MFKRRRWWMAVLILLATIISYLDRGAFGIAAPLISKDLHLSPAELGIVFSGFFIGYALFNFVGGWYSDKFGPKAVLLTSMGIWSLFCGLTSITTGVFSLVAVRAVFGMGEGPLNSASNRYVNHWFPRREQASAAAFSSSGSSIGGAIAGPVVGFLAVTFGWRLAFVAIGLIGVAWLVAWAVVSKDHPADDPRVSAEELQEIISDRENLAKETGLPLRSYLVHPAVLADAFVFFGYSYILFFFSSWFPSYLVNVHHLNLESMGFVSAIPWILGFVGHAAGGFVSDYVFRRTGNALFARKIILVTSMFVAAICVALAGIVSSLTVVVILMSITVFFMHLSVNCFWAIVLDTVEPKHVGGVSGFVHMVASTAGIVSPTMTGLLVQWTGVFTSAFALAGGVAVFGALAVLLLVKPHDQGPPGTAMAFEPDQQAA